MQLFIRFISKFGIILKICVNNYYMIFKNLSLENRPFTLSSPSALYSGVAPSSAHPHPFIGCIRNVEWSSGGAPTAMRLRLKEQARTRPGCVVQNACESPSTQCPTNSRCQRDWERYTCRCLPGMGWKFVGGIWLQRKKGFEGEWGSSRVFALNKHGHCARNYFQFSIIHDFFFSFKQENFFIRASYTLRPALCYHFYALKSHIYKLAKNQAFRFSFLRVWSSPILSTRA